MKQRLYLTFDRSAANQPILSTLTSRFGVVFNIFGATMNDREQFFAVELEGDDAALAAAMDFLSEMGVHVATKPRSRTAHEDPENAG